MFLSPSGRLVVVLYEPSDAWQRSDRVTVGNQAGSCHRDLKIDYFVETKEMFLLIYLDYSTFF